MEDTAVFPTAHAFAETFFAKSRPVLPVTFGAASHPGKVRAQNEDHFAVFRFRRSCEMLLSSLASDDFVLTDACSYAMVVADGMGGMNSGEMASRLALQTMVELSGQATSWVTKLIDLDAQQIRDRAEAYITRVHAALQARGQSDVSMANMGTTWTSAHVLGNTAVVVHVGDSRAYLFRDGDLDQLTHDDTMAQSLIDAGMAPESVEKFSHILVNSLGGGTENAKAAVRHFPLRGDDQLLLCTDGLTGMVPSEAIVAELQRHATPQVACDRLVQLALENGGKDNVTAVLASIGRASA
jgi:protein phosphatase